MSVLVHYAIVHIFKKKLQSIWGIIKRMYSYKIKLTWNWVKSLFLISCGSFPGSRHESIHTYVSGLSLARRRHTSISVRSPQPPGHQSCVTWLWVHSQANTCIHGGVWNCHCPSLTDQGSDRATLSFIMLWFGISNPLVHSFIDFPFSAPCLKEERISMHCTDWPASLSHFLSLSLSGTHSVVLDFL